MSLMETDRPPPVSRRRFSKEFEAGAVALVFERGPAGRCGGA